MNSYITTLDAPSLSFIVLQIISSVFCIYVLYLVISVLIKANKYLTIKLKKEKSENQQDCK